MTPRPHITPRDLALALDDMLDAASPDRTQVIREEELRDFRRLLANLSGDDVRREFDAAIRRRLAAT